jgi:amino acid adenylation domain-containing protein
VVEALKPARSLAHSPLFQVMLSMNTPEHASDFNLPGLTLSSVDVKHKATHFDLTLSFTDTGDIIIGELEYSSDLFNRESAEQWAIFYKNLLAGMIENEGRRISQIPFLTDNELRYLATTLNDNAVAYPGPELIHQFFEAQAAKTPLAIAAVIENQSLTYADLNNQANKLAKQLIAMNAGADQPIGLYADRSLNLVVALLAILKSGAAYLPLDPTLPTERIAFMLNDSEATILLAQEHLIGKLPTNLPCPVLYLDRNINFGSENSRSDEQIANPISLITGDNLAYVIYTSGSTGQPKGVMVSHAAIRNHMCWLSTNYPMDTTDKLLHKTPIGFDASVWDFFATLMSGAQLVMALPNRQFDAEYLIEVISEEKITRFKLTPTLLRLLVENPNFKKCKSLKRVFVGGEALSVELMQRFFEILPDTELFNHYGPTETAVNVTYCQLFPNKNTGKVPIGRPIANTQIYILDVYGEMVAPGVTGELHVGGAGVARGYLNRPDLTAQRFIQDKFSAEKGSRLYKTGDLARYLADGNIEYLGRNDFQVKIRGFRIELSEIEARLIALSGVCEAVVIAREDIPGDKRLVAYLVMNEELSVASLRSQLAAVLPEYMVPSAYVRLDALPFTSNGKLNQHALPPPNQSAVLTRNYEAPQDEMEITIAQIWQELLSLDRIGRNDHFFELGGHSLLATQVVQRIHQKCHVNVALRVLFEKPLLHAFAEAVLSMQFEIFFGKDMKHIENELDSLSKDELLAILAESPSDE